MAQKPETLFRNHIRPLLNKLPNTCVISIQQKTIRGVPDILMCVEGRFIAMELKKSDNDEPSKLQMHWLKRIADSGGIAMVVTPENWNSSYDLLQRLAGIKTCMSTGPTEKQIAKNKQIN